jgi:cellulose biosynthesis protein BcsQ
MYPVDAPFGPRLGEAQERDMAIRLCIGNRQGGVGKSTVTMMLAHALAFLDRKRVLVIDLDTQCNSSFAMVGSKRVLDGFRSRTTLSDYMGARMRGYAVQPANFILRNVGDVSYDGSRTGIDLIPSSIDLDEDIQEAIDETSLPDRFNSMNQLLRELLVRLDDSYDCILMDCPPGLSPLVNAATYLCHRVVVPFRPDYISQYALDRMADRVERTGKASPSCRKLADVPHELRQYVSVVNMYGGTSREDRILDDFDGVHPRLKTRVRRHADVAEAFYWQEEPRSLREKYGDAEPHVRELHDELSQWLEASRPKTPTTFPFGADTASASTTRF